MPQGEKTWAQGLCPRGVKARYNLGTVPKRPAKGKVQLEDYAQEIDKSEVQLGNCAQETDKGKVQLGDCAQKIGKRRGTTWGLCLRDWQRGEEVLGV